MTFLPPISVSVKNFSTRKNIGIKLPFSNSLSKELNQDCYDLIKQDQAFKRSQHQATINPIEKVVNNALKPGIVKTYRQVLETPKSANTIDSGFSSA